MRQMGEELNLHRLTAAGALTKLDQLLHTAFQGGLHGVWVLMARAQAYCVERWDVISLAIFASSPTAEQAALEGAAAGIREMKV